MESIVGTIGRVTGTIAPERLGEVMIPVDGGTQAFIAYASDPRATLRPGTRIVVLEYWPPRTVVVGAAFPFPEGLP